MDITNIIIILIAEKITEDIGIVSLGKYTFPIMPAFDTNVDDVVFTHDEK